MSENPPANERINADAASSLSGLSALAAVGLTLGLGLTLIARPWASSQGIVFLGMLELLSLTVLLPWSALRRAPQFRGPCPHALSLSLGLQLSAGLALTYSLGLGLGLLLQLTLLSQATALSFLAAVLRRGLGVAGAGLAVMAVGAALLAFPLYGSALIEALPRNQQATALSWCFQGCPLFIVSGSFAGLDLVMSETLYQCFPIGQQHPYAYPTPLRASLISASMSLVTGSLYGAFWFFERRPRP